MMAGWKKSKSNLKQRNWIKQYNHFQAKPGLATNTFHRDGLISKMDYSEILLCIYYQAEVSILEVYLIVERIVVELYV